MKWIAALLVSLVPVSQTLAAEPRASDEEVYILVTIADDGASRIDMSGPPGPGYRRRDRYFASLTAERTASRLADEYGLVRRDEWPIRPLNVFCLVFAVPKDAPVDALLVELAARADVESAQRMNEFTVKSGEPDNADPYADLQHTLETLEIRAAHRFSTGRGIGIAIIDTGADVTHPDLRSQVSAYEDFANGDRSTFVTDAHGTAVAGVIAAATGNGYGIVGVAPASRVSVLKACWYEPGRTAAVCNSFTIAKALSHAIESGADVINLSLAGPTDALLADLLGVARRQGIILVAAAPEDRQSGFPAGEPGVIVVDRLPGKTRPMASGLVLAPGNEILVAVPEGRFDYLSGSSLAAAHVSGIVALMLAIRPGLAYDEVRERILASQQAAGHSVNACRAVAGFVDDAACRKDATLADARD